MPGILGTMGVRVTPRRILVVEDEPQIRLTIADALALEGYDVSSATNGAEALAIIPVVRPDAIVFDLWMPVVDGWEFRRAQLASHPDIPVVVLSAMDRQSPRLEELRADAIVSKPFELESLYTAVSGVIARRRSATQFNAGG